MPVEGCDLGLFTQAGADFFFNGEKFRRRVRLFRESHGSVALPWQGVLAGDGRFQKVVWLHVDLLYGVGRFDAGGEDCDLGLITQAGADNLFNGEKF